MSQRIPVQFGQAVSNSNTFNTSVCKAIPNVAHFNHMAPFRHNQCVFSGVVQGCRAIHTSGELCIQVGPIGRNWVSAAEHGVVWTCPYFVEA